MCRLSFHPTTDAAEIDHALNAVRAIVAHGDDWAPDYAYSPLTNEFVHRTVDGHAAHARIRAWFDLGIRDAAD